MNKKALLIDGNLLLFKSFYASSYGSIMQNSSGQQTNAIHTFFMTFFKLIKLIKPDFCFFAFDKGSKTPRHQSFEDYKKGRTQAPDSLFEQMQIVKEILNIIQMPWAENFDFEADDLIASMKQSLINKDSNTQIIIFSSDQDLLQLVDKQTIVVDSIKNDIISTKNIDNFESIMNILPSQVVDFKVLAGDKSDNIKIIEGLGEKGAQKLLKEFNNLNNIIKNADVLSPKISQQIKEKKDKLIFFQNFITLRFDAIFDNSILEKKFQILINDELIALLDKLELKTVKNNFVSYIKK